MKNLIVILDPAHGSDVKGKCSPDGIHKEYLWSRERVRNLLLLLVGLGYKVYTTTNSDKEPGLSKRRNFASSVENGKTKLLLSLHNNAAGSDGKWCSARGVSVYTTKGVTKADKCAEIIFDQFQKDFPDVKMRKYSDEKLGKDFEENFTVLMGSGYMGVLIEWLFQDNKDDVMLLSDETMNERFESSLVTAIELINDQLGK